jgi:hypothetical protein
MKAKIPMLVLAAVIYFVPNMELITLCVWWRLMIFHGELPRPSAASLAIFARSR